LRRKLLQFLFVFHPGSRMSRAKAEAVDRAVSAVGALLSGASPERVYFHFWLFRPFHIQLFHRVVDRLATTLPDLMRAERGAGPEPLFILNTHGLEPLRIRELRERVGGRVLLKVVVDQHFIDDAGPLETYLRRLYAFLEESAQQGQISSLFLNANRGNEQRFTEELLERFMVKGLNRAIVARYFLSALAPKERVEDFYCDMDGVDWGLWMDLVRRTAARPRYRMLSLYGGGVIAKFQRLLTLKKTLLPDVHFCPVIPNSIAFDLAGNLWVCPKAPFSRDGRPGPPPVGRYFPELHVDEGARDAWWERNVTGIPHCSSCPDSFICGGGCAREAWDERGTVAHGVCQPVPDLLSLGVRENFKYLSRKFGPGERSEA
jgi:radical SAM protein with 4Fe4S-binding SPASM domain